MYNLSLIYEYSVDNLATFSLDRLAVLISEIMSFKAVVVIILIV